MQVDIFSQMSCIASNDFVDWCALNCIDYTHSRIYDPGYPHIPYHYTLQELERIYDRKFYSMPIIYINGEFYGSIAAAKEALNEN